MLNMVLLVKGSIETSLVKVIISYIRFLHRLIKSNGPAYVAKYLKASVSLLMQAISGEPHGSTRVLGLAVSRTRRGLPRFIPAVHRQHIRDGSLFYIRLWLSLISVYRVLDFVGKVSLKTIISPSKANINYAEVRQAVIDLKMREVLGDIRPTVLTPFWISSSSPTSTRSIRDGNEVILTGSYSTSLGAIMAAVWAWASEPELIQSYLKICKLMKYSGPLVSFVDFIYYCRGSFKVPFALYLKGRFLINYANAPYLGKLAFKEEPAGKVRVFAMADCFTQWLLKPIHDRLFHFLTTLKSDATFDQLSTVNQFAERIKAKGITKVFSFDLTAATDRIPVAVQADILTHAFWKNGLGEAWATLLTNRWYQVPYPSWDPSAVLARRLGYDPENLPANVRVKRYPWKAVHQSFVVAVKYATGQPMGALSSWAMLAVTHHVMVSIAAKRAGITSFQDYLVLGDDLVIANEEVAKAYLSLAKEWDIEINLSKSVLSRNGSFEFAKRFFYKYQDVSGLSFKEMAVARWDVRALFQMAMRIKQFRSLRISELLNFLGHGYKALSRLSAKYSQMGNGMRKVLLLASYPDSLFSTLTSYEAWLSSSGFNRVYKTVFTQAAKDALIAYLVKVSGKFPKYTLPHGTASAIERLVLDHFPPEIRRNYIKPVKQGSFRTEPNEPVIMQFRFAVVPLFNILWDHFNRVMIETRTKYQSYTNLKEMSVEQLWLAIDEIEVLSSTISNLSQYRLIKDVQTLGSSKLIRKAEQVRRTIAPFTKENNK